MGCSVYHANVQILQSRHVEIHTHINVHAKVDSLFPVDCRVDQCFPLYRMDTSVVEDFKKCEPSNVMS